jgi:hypothetical protein
MPTDYPVTAFMDTLDAEPPTRPVLRLVDADAEPTPCRSHFTPADRRAWDEALRRAGWERTAVVGGRGWYRNARFPNDQNELGWTAPTAMMLERSKRK